MILFEVIAGSVVLLAVLLGAIAGWFIGRRWAARGRRHDLHVLDADADAAIERAAQEWALSRGRPWAVPLIADKLRMAYELRRTARRSGRRS